MKFYYAILVLRVRNKAKLEHFALSKQILQFRAFIHTKFNPHSQFNSKIKAINKDFNPHPLQSHPLQIFCTFSPLDPPPLPFLNWGKRGVVREAEGASIKALQF